MAENTEQSETDGGAELEEQLEPSTHFVFEHKAFNTPGVFFGLTADTKVPSFFFPMGSMHGALPLSLIRREFSIPAHHPDSRLIEIAERSLRYVKEIRPNDSIPREILDGTASWNVTAKHRTIAQLRLTVQLVSWMRGTPLKISGMSELQKLAVDPEIKTQTQKAFTRLAEELGLPTAQKQDVIDRIDQLGREMSYIEGLRDHFGNLHLMRAKFNEFTGVYAKEASVLEDLMRMGELIQRPINDIGNIFSELDRHNDDLVEALSKFEKQVYYIREMRDELHQRFMDWDEQIRAWRDMPTIRNDIVPKLCRNTYRFLAQNFARPTPWKVPGRAQIFNKSTPELLDFS